ncbi:unnamed protein product [Ceutorhynchus assimilis]|uniref:Uncharacterized protein n=1 Tax=Ceutorhynchus assimilis TaxID=467358 RepID=A0A9N9QPI4_9CUCU|nr:unnamed protein product [Ceutorhynchus assimilis]
MDQEPLKGEPKTISYLKSQTPNTISKISSTGKEPAYGEAIKALRHENESLKEQIDTISDLNKNLLEENKKLNATIQQIMKKINELISLQTRLSSQVPSTANHNNDYNESPQK